MEEKQRYGRRLLADLTTEDHHNKYGFKCEWITEVKLLLNLK
jgi:hypothetical protein